MYYKGKIVILEICKCRAAKPVHSLKSMALMTSLINERRRFKDLCVYIKENKTIHNGLGVWLNDRTHA